MRRDATGPWGLHPLHEGVDATVDIGPLELRFRAVGPELWIAWTRASIGATTGESETVDWQRWATGGAGGEVSIRPVLPDRPLVVAPEVSFNLAPQSSARIYLRIPLVAAVVLPRQPDTSLLEVPAIIMSNTWWGSLHEGDLCYWLPTKARPALVDEHFEPFLLACPVEIQNQAEEVLQVTKFAVRVDHFSIYAQGDKLWADETLVTYRAEEDGSEIEMSGEPPREAEGAVLLAPPRVPLPRGFRAKTFAVLKSISGF